MFEKNAEFQQTLRKKSDIRLRLGVAAFLRIQRQAKMQPIAGLDVLEGLDPDEAFIIATTHATGFDIPLSINAVSKHLDIAIADQSTHSRLENEPIAYISQKLTGSANYLPVSYSWHGKTQKRADAFNPTDSQPIERGLRLGKSVLIAAHNPIMLDQNGTPIPPRPGYMAAYTAATTGAKILPLGVSYVPTGKSRVYETTVSIGEPFRLNTTTDVVRIHELSERRQEAPLSREETRALTAEFRNLRNDGGAVLRSVQALQTLEGGYPIIDNAYASRA